MRPSAPAERRLLQSIVAALALLPVLAGVAGVVWGLGAFDPFLARSLDGDSHMRYLSGIILAIGLGFWSTVPRIERHGDRFRLLTALVLIGGCSRLYGIARHGMPGIAAQAALLIELVVTPGLAFWRESVDVRGNGCRVSSRGRKAA